MFIVPGLDRHLAPPEFARRVWLLRREAARFGRIRPPQNLDRGCAL